MLVMSQKVVCDWDPEMWERNRRLHPENVFYQVPILAGPEKEIPKQAPQTAMKRSGFGQDPYPYMIIKPL